MHSFPFRQVFSGLTCLLLAGLLTLPSTAAYGNEGSLQAFQSTSSVYYSGIGEVSGPGLTPTELPTRTDNFDEAPAFSGGEIRFLANTSTDQQQLSGVFRSSDGKVLVVDGGVAADTEHLISVLQEYGGTVDAWLITHPQDDHVGALYEILTKHSDRIHIRNIYFHFLEEDWYGEVAPEDQPMVENLLAALRALPSERLHGFGAAAPGKGVTVVLSDCLRFQVINDPLQMTGPYAVNNSSLMYDITMDGKHIIVLGDMGPDGGDKLLPQILMSKITADYVVMSHHGQNGVRENFYRALRPQACIWSCPDWLFNAPPKNQNRLRTDETKSFIKNMGITRNYCTKDGDVILR